MVVKMVTSERDNANIAGTRRAVKSLSKKSISRRRSFGVHQFSANLDWPVEFQKTLTRSSDKPTPSSDTSSFPQRFRLWKISPGRRAAPSFQSRDTQLMSPCCCDRSVGHLVVAFWKAKKADSVEPPCSFGITQSHRSDPMMEWSEIYFLDFWSAREDRELWHGPRAVQKIFDFRCFRGNSPFNRLPFR